MMPHDDDGRSNLGKMLAHPGGTPKLGPVAWVPSDPRTERVRVHAGAAFVTLVAVMIDAGATPPPRVSAAIATLDRGYGKPAQTVHQHVARHLDDYSDAELIAIATGSDPAAASDADGAEEVDSVH